MHTLDAVNAANKLLAMLAPSDALLTTHQGTQALHTPSPITRLVQQRLKQQAGTKTAAVTGPVLNHPSLSEEQCKLP